MFKSFLRNILALILMLSFGLSFAQTDQNILQLGEEKARLFKANNEFLSGNYYVALEIYKDVLKNKPNDASLNFHTGEVLFSLENYEEAKEYLDKAYSIDKTTNTDLTYYLGRTYHMLGDVEKAVTYLEEFKKQFDTPKKYEEYQVDFFISQCISAKELIKKPVNVKIENAGKTINSEYEDKGPSVTADGKQMVFTSRRPLPKNEKKKEGEEEETPLVDAEGDYKFFEDIYIAQWDDVSKSWKNAEYLEGSVNTESYDACLSISPDGKQIFIYRNNATDARGGDIFVSKVQNAGRWGKPKKMPKPINSSYVENGCVISADGTSLFFVSERPKQGDQKGVGKGDIWMCKLIAKNKWGPPINLGPEVNTPEDEGGIFLHPDGKTLFFSSEGHNSMGSYDIFVTRFENGRWTKPANLGYPINTTRKDVSFVLSTDGKKAYFASNRPGGYGERDIYEVDMNSYPILNSGSGVSVKLGILKGTVMVQESGKGVQTEIILIDKATGQKVTSTGTNEQGEYFFTVPTNKNYVIEVTVKGYQKISETVFLPTEGKDGTSTLVKHILLIKGK